MSYGIEACVLALLRTDPELAVPLSRLHGALLEEAGPAIGARGPLRDRLRRRSDLFILLEPDPTPWGSDEWPAAVRREYRLALREAGFEPEPRVVPRLSGLEPDSEAGLISTLRDLSGTLIDLWKLSGDDPETRDQISAALSTVSLMHDTLSRLSASPPNPEESAPPLLFEILGDEDESG